MTELYAILGVLCASELPWLRLGVYAFGIFAAGAATSWAWHRRRCRRRF
jgi:hypothetical protein